MIKDVQHALFEAGFGDAQVTPSSLHPDGTLYCTIDYMSSKLPDRKEASIMAEDIAEQLRLCLKGD